MNRPFALVLIFPALVGKIDLKTGQVIGDGFIFQITAAIDGDVAILETVDLVTEQFQLPLPPQYRVKICREISREEDNYLNWVLCHARPEHEIRRNALRPV